jgi:hypothetical protein
MALTKPALIFPADIAVLQTEIRDQCYTIIYGHSGSVPAMFLYCVSAPALAQP